MALSMPQRYSCGVSVPLFDPESGSLPPGEHVASWDDVLDRFGWNQVRRRQLDGLSEALELLAEAGCRRVWLNGSFVTAKDEPGDFDAVWDPDGVDTERLDPIFFDLGDGRLAQKQRFGGELFPDWTESETGLRFAEFFQRDRSGNRKGIIVLELKARKL